MRCRDAFVAHVAEVHALPCDAERWEDYRKEEVKELVISLVFGGVYEGWLRKRGLDTAPAAPRSPKIVRLQAELAALRDAVFTSLRWAPHVAEQRERLRRIGRKETDDEIDRSVFALIAQSEEDRILLAMRRSADAQGFAVLSLQFDGFFVRRAPRAAARPRGGEGGHPPRHGLRHGRRREAALLRCLADADAPARQRRRAKRGGGAGAGAGAGAGGGGRPPLLDAAPSPLLAPSAATAARSRPGAADPQARHAALLAALDPSVVAAGIVPLAEGGLWLSLQTMPRGAPKWAEPGGKRDARDATLWETAVREAREETGLDFGGARLERADQIFYGSSRTGLNYVFFFVAAPGAPRLTGDRRIVEHRLWRELPPADALHPRLRFATGMRVRLRE